jgi:hypothetical protein
MAQKDAAKTHCPQGHPYDETNTYIDTDGGRRCRECARAGAAERNRRYRQRHPERVREGEQRYRERNRERLRVENRERERERRERARLAVIAALGGVCCDCGFSDVRALEVDHVNDDGTLDRARFASGTGINIVLYLQQVVSEARSGRYQLLCRNCNWIKEIERRRRERL